RRRTTPGAACRSAPTARGSCRECGCLPALSWLPLVGNCVSREGRLFVHGLRLGAGRVLVGVDPDVDHGRLATRGDLLTRAAQCRADLGRVGHLLAVAAEHLGELAERHVAELVADVAALLAVLGDL